MCYPHTIDVNFRPPTGHPHRRRPPLKWRHFRGSILRHSRAPKQAVVRTPKMVAKTMPFPGVHFTTFAGAKTGHFRAPLNGRQNGHFSGVRPGVPFWPPEGPKMAVLGVPGEGPKRAQNRPFGAPRVGGAPPLNTYSTALRWSRLMSI